MAIHIALAKGRIHKAVMKYLADSGYEFPTYSEESRRLIFEDAKGQLKVTLVKSPDVAVYVERGAADVGIVGKDVLLEEAPGADVYEVMDLGIGCCRMAVAIMNLIAPEHLEIAFSDAEAYAKKIVNAGAIFIGPYTTEPLGDYFAGPNHTLPTMGTAAFSSPLGVYDFVKRSSLLSYNKEAFEAVADKVIRFANVEGLQAHGLAVRRRIDE